MLREALQENHYPDAETRQDLATKLNLTMHQIKVSTFSQCGNIRIFPSFHISREINFGESESPKNAVFAILVALYFLNLVHFSLQKVQKIIKVIFQSL